jgi:hypothetical protein
MHRIYRMGKRGEADDPVKPIAVRPGRTEA